jgi:hypothetical protein
MDDGLHRRVACRFSRLVSRGSACGDHPPITHDRPRDGLTQRAEDASGQGRARRATVDPDGQELPDWLSYSTVSDPCWPEPHDGMMEPSSRLDD